MSSTLETVDAIATNDHAFSVLLDVEGKPTPNIGILKKQRIAAREAGRDMTSFVSSLQMVRCAWRSFALLAPFRGRFPSCEVGASGVRLEAKAKEITTFCDPRQAMSGSSDTTCERADMRDQGVLSSECRRLATSGLDAFINIASSIVGVGLGSCGAESLLAPLRLNGGVLETLPERAAVLLPHRRCELPDGRPSMFDGRKCERSHVCDCDGGRGCTSGCECECLGF